MNKINIPLIVGCIIVLGIIFLIFFGDYFAPHDYLVGEQSAWVETENGERVLKRAPFAPDETYLLGTDNGGRDVLSIIMAGAKNTFTIVFLATIFRFIVAIPIAFLSAFGEKISRRLIVIFSSSFSVIPSVIISIMVLKIHSISQLSLGPSMAAFIIVFVFVGWGRLASTIEERIKDVLNQDFIKGEIAIGKSKFAIATQNVVAHIIPSVAIYIFLEIALVLLLLAQLGIFEVFVGNKEVVKVTSVGGVSISNYNFFPEWGAMLASTKKSIISNKFWFSIFPILAFSTSIIGFNLLGQGLNHELNKRNSKAISYVKKFFFHLSPKTFIVEVINFKKNTKSVIIKSFVIIIISLSIIIPIFNYKMVIEERIMLHVEEFNQDKYEGRLVGTSGRDEAAKYISSQLKDANIEPLFDGNYISEFTINKTKNIISDSQFYVTDNTDEKLDEFKYKVDYYFHTWNSTSTNILEGEILTYSQYESNQYNTSNEYFLILSDKQQNQSLQRKLLKELTNKNYIKGIIVPDRKENYFLNKRIELEKRGLVKILDEDELYSEGLPPIKIQVGIQAAKKITNLAGNKITIKAKTDNPDGIIGKNIGGIIKGKNSENPIVITTTYDYLGDHDIGININTENIIRNKGLYENGTSIGGSIEIARNLSNIMQRPEKSIIFIFLDGSKISNDCIYDLERYDILSSNTLLINLKYMGINKWSRPEDTLYYNTVLNNSDKEMEREFYKWLRKSGMTTDTYVKNDNFIRAEIFRILSDREISGIVLQGIQETERSWHIGMPQSNLSEIDKDRLRNHIQSLQESIIEISYGKIWLK